MRLLRLCFRVDWSLSWMVLSTGGLLKYLFVTGVFLLQQSTLCDDRVVLLRFAFLLTGLCVCVLSNIPPHALYVPSCSACIAVFRAPFFTSLLVVLQCCFLLHHSRQHSTVSLTFSLSFPLLSIAFLSVSLSFALSLFTGNRHFAMSRWLYWLREQEVCETPDWQRRSLECPPGKLQKIWTGMAVHKHLTLIFIPGPIENDCLVIL